MFAAYGGYRCWLKCSVVKVVFRLIKQENSIYLGEEREIIRRAHVLRTCVCVCAVEELLCLFVCLFVCLFACLRLFVCVSSFVCLCVFVCLFVCLRLFVCVPSFVCLCVFVCLFVCLRLFRRNAQKDAGISDPKFKIITVFFYQIYAQILYCLIHLLHSSTCFEDYYAHPQEVKLY